MIEGKQLKIVRFFKDFSQYQLSILSGVPQSEISKLENDLLPNTPSVKKMKERIARVLKISSKNQKE